MKPKITGLFIPADAMAVPVYHCLRELGVEPMRDIEIISVDNIEVITKMLQPGLVEIDTGFDMIGALALEHMNWRFKKCHSDRRVSICVEPCLVKS
jgi:DNA-binding LacI/PurR family transcriptional regulator